MARLTKADKAFLDDNMWKYLDRRSVTPFVQILGHFELHTVEEIEMAVDRLVDCRRVEYDPRRGGYSTRRP